MNINQEQFHLPITVKSVTRQQVSFFDNLKHNLDLHMAEVDTYIKEVEQQPDDWKEKQQLLDELKRIQEVYNRVVLSMVIDSSMG
jgi:flagellar biosynthesis chaperone FliJ